ncbi:Chitinase 1 [Steccherinum ochraceum]|uniref:chitinase n=1 Tax=Steccherinum ochraceum TaxID=92696 RepID=A0A4R0RIX1_9APHY|nr:Chitinase 1 [Steccherinum ochraceum]
MVSAAIFLHGLSSLIPLALVVGLSGVLAFDGTKKDNLAVYWGQDGAGSQQNLAFYCADETIDVIPLAFLYIFRGTGGDPVVDLGAECSDWNTDVFPGTDLVKCPSAMANDIKTCQSKGKLVTLSLGGATGQVGFSSDSQAQTFADQIWNEFLGGSSSTRPFGDAVLDGVDLDIESGTAAHYAAFVNRIKSHASGASKKFYVTAAPQCPYPDAFIGDALNAAPFDAVYVQFYNNFCGLNHASDYNLATWDNWAKTKSANKNVKVYIGAPGSADAAGEGYVDVGTLSNYVSEAQQQFSSFGGVMLWDADSAYTNNRFDKAVKTAMSASAKKINPSFAHSSDTPAATHTTAPPHTVPPPHTTHISQSSQPAPKPTASAPPLHENQPGPDKAPHELLHKEPRSYSRFFRF